MENLIDGKGVASRLFLGIFPCEVKNIIFSWIGAHEVRLNPSKVRLKLNIGSEYWRYTHPSQIGVRQTQWWPDGGWGVGARLGTRGGLDGGGRGP